MHKTTTLKGVLREGVIEMYEMTLEGLLRVGNSDYAKNEAKWMVLKIEGVGEKAEIIVNPRENFESKLKYIQKAYNEDLTLKNAPHIKIIDYYFLEHLGDVE